MRKVVFSVAVVTIVGLVQGCGAIRALSSAPAGTQVNASAAALAEFRERVDRYMKMRGGVVEQVGEAEFTSAPAAIWGREQALAQRLRAGRAKARHGDIFTPEVRIVFRRLLKPELRGDDGQDIRNKLQDDAPAPGAVPLEVNARYPAGQPFPTTPAPL